MVKNSRNTKKLLCLFLIMCLAASMLLTTSFASSEGSDKPTLSPLQKVIQEALKLNKDNRELFTSLVLGGTDLPVRISEAKKLIPDLNDDDITKALEVFDDDNYLSDIQRGSVCTFINKLNLPSSIDINAFPNIAKKINTLVTNDESGPDNIGIKLTVAIFDLITSKFDIGAVVRDGDSDADEIKFVCNINTFYKNSITGLIKCIDTLDKKSIKDFDTLLNRASGVINDRVSYKDDVEKKKEIKNFKKYLEDYSSLIYSGKYDKPTPTTYNPPQSNSTPTATPTPTSTAIPTPTITTSPTPTADIKSSDKQITSFSFKGIKPEANGAIFEKTHTIIVKVPMETDLKGLVPTIEYKGASIKPDSGEKKNFTNPVFYTVTAKDKSTARYVVIVVRAKNSEIIDPNEYPSVPGRDIFGHWAEDHLIGLIENGIITGYPDGSIKPDTHMTRAEVVTLIVKSLGLSPAKDAKFNFKDSKDIPTWAQGYFKTALEKGFIKGYPNNTLKPMEKVTRAEFTVMVINAFGFDISKTADVKFNDAKNGIPDWAKLHVSSAVNLKIISGYSDNTFRPNNFITRAEVGTIVDRCFGASGKSYPGL